MVNLLEYIEGKRTSKNQANFLISSWLSLMHAVGSWVSFDEFKNMSCELNNDLLNEAVRRQDEQNKKSKKR